MGYGLTASGIRSKRQKRQEADYLRKMDLNIYRAQENFTLNNLLSFDPELYNEVVKIKNYWWEKGREVIFGVPEEMMKKDWKEYTRKERK